MFIQGEGLVQKSVCDTLALICVGLISAAFSQSRDLWPMLQI